jgi:hypothetical protein
VAVVVVVTAGGLAVYLASSQGRSQAVPHHKHVTLSARVLSSQTVGVIDFGPDDDRDAFANDPDDHPLQLQPVGRSIRFVTISPAELAAGVPLWTANKMSDGTEIFIYIRDGRCLTAVNGGKAVTLSHCTLALSQRWRPIQVRTTLGQPVAQYANAQTGGCLTAPPPPANDHAPANPGPATLSACGQAGDKTQEIAFWWGA